MRISDWSSDVCSSYLAYLRHAILPRESRRAFPRKSHHIGSVSPFTARAFRFTPTRRAKIRAGMTPLVRALPKRSRGAPVRTPRRGRNLSSLTTGLRRWRQRFDALFQDHEIGRAHV